jgi:putative addiction module component (TIGR02574 family)
MTSGSKKVLHDALALPREQRSKVAAELIASLDDQSDEQADAAWAEEIHRRVSRIRSGHSEGVPAEDVHARIRAALRR